MQTPRLEKIVVNIGVGENVADSKKINAAVDDLALITGQKPSITKAKKEIKFQHKINLEEGLKELIDWKKNIKINE